MVYNVFSYRRWARWPLSTARHALWNLGLLSDKPSAAAAERLAYDANTEGQAPPETDFLSRSELRNILIAFDDIRIRARNIGSKGPLRLVPRSVNLKLFGPRLGLDLSVQASKR